MRAAAKAPSPVSRKGVRYEVVRGGKGRGLGQNGGLIAAVDAGSGQELWVLKVYEVHYDGDMEDDKQDVFITDLSLGWFGNKLTVRNERGERYVVDLDTREVSPA
jgi:hypothetical protein